MNKLFADDQQLRPDDAIDIHAYDTPAGQNSALIASLKSEAQLLERHQLIRELQRLQVAIGGHHGEMERVQKYASELSAVLTARDAEIGDFERELDALRSILAARDAEVSDFGCELDALRTILAARDAEIINFGHELAGLRAILAARDAEISDFGRELAARDAAIAAASIANGGTQAHAHAEEA